MKKMLATMFFFVATHPLFSESLKISVDWGNNIFGNSVAILGESLIGDRWFAGLMLESGYLKFNHHGQHVGYLSMDMPGERGSLTLKNYLITHAMLAKEQPKTSGLNFFTRFAFGISFARARFVTQFDEVSQTTDESTSLTGSKNLSVVGIYLAGDILRYVPKAQRYYFQFGIKAPVFILSEPQTINFEDESGNITTRRLTNRIFGFNPIAYPEFYLRLAYAL